MHNAPDRPCLRPGIPNQTKPQKAPRTGTLAERAERAAGDRQRGAAHVDEWVEQQQQQQHCGVWVVRAITAEATNRDLEAHLSRANEDTRAAETQLAAVTRERDRLASRVKTLERVLGTVRKAAGGRQPAQTGEGAEGAEGPTAERAGGGHSCWRSLPFSWRAGMTCPG